MQLPFGLEIKRKPNNDAKNRPVRNSYLPAILDKFSYGRELSSDEDYSSFLMAYRDIVYIAAKKNADAVASAKPRLYVAKPNSQTRMRFMTRKVDSKTKDSIFSDHNLYYIPQVRKALDFEEILEHPMLSLMQRVNPYMTYAELMRLSDLWLELTGNCFWLKVYNRLGTPVEIWPMFPSKVKIIPDEKNFISGYAYGSTFSNIKFKEEEIIQFKFVNPNSLYWGHSPLAAIKAEYNLNQTMNEYEQNSFKNSGKPEGYWQLADSLDAEDFAKLKQELADIWGGSRNANRSSLVDSGLEYKAISLSPKEMSYLSGRANLRETILNAFGQNTGLYSESATRANSDSAIYTFMKNAIAPRIDLIEQKINEKLVIDFDENIFIKYDNVVPEDREEIRKERVEYVNAGIMSRNEVRKDMRLLPFEGHDEPWLQIQYQPNSNILAGLTLPGNPRNSDSSPKKEDVKAMVDEIKRQLSS